MNKPTLLSTLAVGLALVGPATAQSTVTLNFSFAGKSRNAVIYVPAGISKPPVVYFVHGYGGSGTNFANDTKGNQVAEREKFIAIYPSAIGGSWSMQDTADYPFLLSLLDTVDRRYKVDRERVYCTGFSQGGFISNGLGYKHPETFAAVAPVSGHIPSFSTAAPLKRPVPILTMFGTDDVSDVASFMKDINTWIKLNGCNTASKTSQRPYPATNKSSMVAKTTYLCSQGSEVVYDSMITGGHEWPMNTNTKVNTTEEVWAFFKRFTRSGNAYSAPRDQVGVPTIHAIFQAGEVLLDDAQEVRNVTVSRMDGTVLLRSSVDQGRFRFPDASAGIFLITSWGAWGSKTSLLNVP